MARPSQASTERVTHLVRAFVACALLALFAVAPTRSAAQANGSAKAAAADPLAASGQTLTPALASSLWSKAGRPVEAIHLAGVVFGDHDPIRDELKQQAGRPLDPEAVRADLRTLFATGRYKDIRVSSDAAAPDGKGLILTYAGTPRYFVGRVTVTGVNADRLVSLLEVATKLDPGKPYADDDLARAEAGIKETLARNGYLVPKIDEQTARDEAHTQIDLTFHVTLGVQARVGKVLVGGNDPGISVEDFRRRGGLNCSRLITFFKRSCEPKVTQNTVSNALSGVRSFYLKNHHLEGTISLPSSAYNQQRREMDYDFSADQGPVVQVVVNGFKISASRIRLLVPVYQEGAVDNDLLNEGSFNIRDYMQQRGYFDVKVSVALTGKDTKNVTVAYSVTPGPKHKVVSVQIVGNHYFDTSTIEELLRVKKGDAYQPSGKYSGTLVRSDTSAIEALYRSNGFEDVHVTSKVSDTDDAPGGQHLKRARLSITYHIVEGSQQHFGSVTLAGVDAARATAVKALLSSAPGQPYSLLTLSNDRDAIYSYYLSQGYEHVRVDLAQETAPGAAGRMNVSLKVTEGPQVRVDDVLLSGRGHIRLAVIENQITVHAGAPLDQAALLQTQRNLYNLAEFNEVDVAVQDPDGREPAKNVLVQLTEARRWDVTYGFGFEAQSGTPGLVPGQTRGSTAAQNGSAGVSPRVSLDVGRTALRGTQDSLTLHTTYGLLEEIATLSYNSPRLFGKEQFTGTLSGGYSNVQDITTFASRTLQGDLRISQKRGKADTLIYDFQYRRVSIDQNSLEIAPNLINQLSEPVIVGGPAFTYLHDTRDPSPLNATKGHLFSFQDFLATSKFGSGTNFNQVDSSESSYYVFGKRKYVFARNLRIGFENSWGPNPNAVNAGNQIGVSAIACAGTLLQTNPTCNPVPLPERLYAGGATSHRGFGINDAGPRDLTTGFPVGGSGVVVNTFELRLPPPTLPYVGDAVSFVIFHDMGNTFQYPGNMFTSFLHFHQPNSQTCRDLTIPGVPAGTAPTATQQANAVGTCNFNYYSHAIGLGLRYSTPVGPLRADFSYNLNPPIYPVFDDYTGALPYVGQANHFNFFFSIGQSF